MSEETVGALFEYPYNQYLMTRLEFVLITNDELEAKIMRIIEVEMLKVKAIWQRAVLEAIEKKQEPPPEPEEYWVTMSRGLFIAFLYKFDTATVGAKHPNSISKSSLRRAIDDLIDVKQFLFSRAQPGNEFGATQYTLNREVIQERMRNLPKHPMSLFLKGYSNLETGGVSNLETPTSQKGNSSVSNLTTPQFPNLRTLSNSNLDNNNLDKDTYSENVANANSHAPTPLSLEDMITTLQANGYNISQQSPSQLSTPTTDLSPESVDKSVQTDEETSVPPQASEQSYSRETTQPVAPAQSPDSGESTPPSEKPARPARQRKPKESMEPIAPPSKPESTLPFNAEKILAWGDYARQAKLSHSGRKDSKYQKAIEAARTIEGWKISEDNFLLIYFNWMKGISLDLEPLGEDKLKSDTWSDFPVDLWVFAEHYQTEKGRYQKKKAERINLEKERENAGAAVATHATSMIGVSGLPRFQASPEKLVFRPTPNKKQPQQKRSNVG